MPSTAVFSPCIWGGGHSFTKLHKRRLVRDLIVSLAVLTRGREEAWVESQVIADPLWADTWSLTLAVSRGKVTRSAIHAAAPALAILTPSGGGTSEGLSPTMVVTAVKYKMRAGMRNPSVSATITVLLLVAINVNVCPEPGVRGYTHAAELLSCWADFERPGYNPHRTGLKGKMHLLLHIYRTACLFLFFMTSQERRCFELLDTRVKSKSTAVRKSMFNLQARFRKTTVSAPVLQHNCPPTITFLHFWEWKS